MKQLKCKKILCYFLILSSLIALSSCSGWRLRGSDASTSNLAEQSVFLSGKSSETYLIIEKQLTRKNNLTSFTNAHLQLVLEDEQWQRRSISISRSDTIAEYELILSITYTVLDNKQRVLRGPSNSRVIRSFAYDENDISGKAKEELLIRQDLRRSASRQILQQLELSQR